MGNEWRWLESTRHLQEESFGKKFPLVGDDLADYVTENYAAAVIELGELMQEVGWKPWSTPRGWANREAALGELVDVLHFLANLAVALDVREDELWNRYRAKQNVNRARQRSGYDAREGKCPRCHRSYDDLGVNCARLTVDAVNWTHWCARDGEYVEGS